MDAESPSSFSVIVPLALVLSEFFDADIEIAWHRSMNSVIILHRRLKVKGSQSVARTLSLTIAIVVL
jgi:hypothetical protein